MKLKLIKITIKAVTMKQFNEQMNRNFRWSLFLFLSSFLFFSSAISQRLSPYNSGSSGSYYPGLINVRDHQALNPGIYIRDYNVIVNDKGFFDDEGKEFTGGTVEVPGSKPVNVSFEPDLSVYVNMPVLYYVSRFNYLGRGRYLAAVAPVIMSSSYDVFLSSEDSETSISGSASGFGDLYVMPLGLAWSLGPFFDISFKYGFYAPTGRYQVGANDNKGRGFWAHQAQLPMCFYTREKKFAFSITPTLELNSPIKNTDFRPASRLTIEYGISRQVNHWLEFSVMGGHNFQVTEDFGPDQWWSGTRFDSYDQKSTLGFGVGLTPWKDRLSFALRYGLEYAAKQRFKNEVWTLTLYFDPHWAK